MNRLFSSSALASCGVALVLGSSPAWAEPPGPSSDPATARALFYEARALMRENKFGIACPKLEESLRLDYGVGTEFNLADCNEKVGKIATAWARFNNVATAARARNQPDREKVALDRAKALERRLPKLTVEVAAQSPPNLEVRRDGVVIDSGSWGTAMPIDPGFHRIIASAPGRRSFEATMTAVEGKPARIVIPALAEFAIEAPALPTSNEATNAARSETNNEHARRFEQLAPFPEPVVEQRGRTQRIFGWTLGVAGLAGLGVGAGFGLDSLQKRERAKDHCDGDLCDREGLSLRDKAIVSGNVATISTIAGGATLLGGLILVLTAPRSSGRKEAPLSSFQAVPHIAANGGGISVQGLLP